MAARPGPLAPAWQRSAGHAAQAPPTRRRTCAGAPCSSGWSLSRRRAGSRGSGSVAPACQGLLPDTRLARMSRQAPAGASAASGTWHRGHHPASQCVSGRGCCRSCGSTGAWAGEEGERGAQGGRRAQGQYHPWGSIPWLAGMGHRAHHPLATPPTLLALGSTGSPLTAPCSPACPCSRTWIVCVPRRRRASLPVPPALPRDPPPPLLVPGGSHTNPPSMHRRLASCIRAGGVGVFAARHAPLQAPLRRAPPGTARGPARQRSARAQPTAEVQLHLMHALPACTLSTAL